MTEPLYFSLLLSYYAIIILTVSRIFLRTVNFVRKVIHLQQHFRFTFLRHYPSFFIFLLLCLISCFASDTARLFYVFAICTPPEIQIYVYIII